jgi:hypothetical protein
MVTARTVSIQPMQWSRLQDLTSTPPLDDSDMACLSEVRDTLARHGKLRRFAVHLAHRHFDLGEGEVLIERPDDVARTQHVSVGRATDGMIPTTWLFAEHTLLASAVYCVCVSDPNKTDACARHGKSGSPGEVARKEEAAKQKRIGEEKGEYDRGFPVGGHDWDRER